LKALNCVIIKGNNQRETIIDNRNNNHHDNHRKNQLKGQKIGLTNNSKGTERITEMHRTEEQKFFLPKNIKLLAQVFVHFGKKYF